MQARSQSRKQEAERLRAAEAQLAECSFHPVRVIKPMITPMITPVITTMITLVITRISTPMIKPVITPVTNKPAFGHLPNMAGDEQAGVRPPS